MNTLASPASDRPLAGLNVVELHAIGPVPFAGMLLRNLGATVTRVSPPVDPGLGVPGKPIPDWFTRQFSLYHLLERYLADPGARRRAAQLAAFQAEDGRLVLRSLPWVAR